MTSELPEIPDEPLEYQWRPKAMAEIPAELVVSLAQGLHTEAELAARFGFTPEHLQRLLEYPPFRTAVATKRAELEKSGWVFRQKAAMQAEMLMDQVFVNAMSNDVGLMQKLETLKYLSKMGNLEPKEDKNTSAGPGFQISINLGDQSVSIGHTPQNVVEMAEIAPKSPFLAPRTLPFDTLDIPEPPNE